MAYQKGEKVRLHLNATVEGTFLNYDQNTSKAWILLGNMKEPTLVPTENICDEDVVLDGSQEITLSEDSQQTIKRMIELMNY